LTESMLLLGRVLMSTMRITVDGAAVEVSKNRPHLRDPLLLLETIGISSMGRRLYRSLDYHVLGIVPQALIRTAR